MATNKLTLSVEPDLVDKAKKYALKHRTSVSKIFSELLEKAIKNEPLDEVDPFLERIRKMPVSENIESLTGILKGRVPDNVDIDEAKYDYLKQKHGL